MALSVKSSKLGKRTHKIIFLGDSGVGKTSVMSRYV
jgi:GTPase SAR1 family protein